MRTRYDRKTISGLAIALLVMVALPFLSPEQRLVAYPVVAVLAASGAAFLILWSRDGILPLFDVGIVCLAFTTLYTVIPPIMYLLSDMQWTILSDTRLYDYDPSPAQFGAFSWMPATYAISLAVSYLFFRGRSAAGNVPIVPPGRQEIRVIILLALLITGFFGFYQWVTGVDVGLNQSYEKSREALATGSLEQVPLFIRQISHNLYGMLMILKYALVLWLVCQWRNRWCRYALAGWMLAEGLVAFTNMGSRSWFLFLVLSAALAYHRVVKPVKLLLLATFSVVLILGSLAYGFARDYGEASIDIDPNVSLLSTATEFQILYGTPYDLLRRQEEGSLPPIPWQVYLSDVLLLVPQQLLPVQKIDPSEWYLELIGLRGTGLGLMFGVVSQAVIGWGWTELVLRGALVGLILALFHRWYVKRSSSFWATLLYLWLCLWSYYSYRGSSFFVGAFLVYRFLPVYLVVTLASRRTPWLRPFRPLLAAR